VAAVAAGDYSAYEDWQSNVQKSNDARKMVFTYECGARRSDEDLKAAYNGYSIDLSKLGCSPACLMSKAMFLSRATKEPSVRTF
jgi:hypothetical protein